jgi:hypothetical protein
MGNQNSMVHISNCSCQNLNAFFSFSLSTFLPSFLPSFLFHTTENLSTVLFFPPPVQAAVQVVAIITIQPFSVRLPSVESTPSHWAVLHPATSQPKEKETLAHWERESTTKGKPLHF